MKTVGGYALLFPFLLLACSAASEDASTERHAAPAQSQAPTEGDAGTASEPPPAAADAGAPGPAAADAGAPGPAPTDAGAPDPAPADGPPVLVAPADGDVVHARRPSLRWSGRSADATGTVQICRDSTCAYADVTVAALAGATEAPFDLEPGTYHWRAAWAGASDESLVWSAPRAFVVAADAPETAEDPDLLSVWSVAPGEAFAAGARGTILHHVAGAWAREPSGTTATLRGIWASPDLAWAVGDGGTILRRQAGAWSVVPSSTTDDLHGVWAAGPDAAWAVGSNGVVLRWDGLAWSHVDAGAPGEVTALNGVWGRSASDVWIVGEGREPDRDYTAILLHWDGATWSTTYVCNPEGTRFASGGWVASLVDVWGAGGTLWAPGGCGPGAAQMSIGYVADDATGAWGDTEGARSFFDDRALDAVWGSSASDVWVAAGNAWTPRLVPTILHFDGSAWSASTDPKTVGIRDLSGTGANDVWAVGVAGKRLHFDGASWSKSP
jgi:hypothetical protein